LYFNSVTYCLQNGFMQTSQVTYKSIAESGSPYMCNEPSSYPLNVTKAPIKVVTALTTPNGIGGTTTSTYKYENARLHRSGFGFLGFGKFQVDNPVQYAQVITETEVLTPYQSPVTYYFPVVKTVTSSQVLGNVTLPVSKTTNTSSPTFNGTRYWMKVDATTSTNNLTGATSSSTTTYDANGNATFTSANINNEEYAYTWYNWQGEGFTPFGSPKFIYSYKERVGQNRVYKQMRNTYNTQGDVLTSIDYDYNGFWNETTTSTNTYHLATGSPLSKKITSPALQTKTSTFEYDTRYRYVTKVINPLGQFGTKTYDPRWGTVATETDIAGLKTTHTYDGFGKLINTLTPQGHNITVEYAWSYEGAYLPSRCYDIITTVPGKPQTWDIYDVLGRKTVETPENYGDVGSRWVRTYSVTEYDVRGNVATTTTPVNATDWANRQITTYSYNVFNMLTSTVNSIGTTKYLNEYNNGGKTTSYVTNAAGQRSSKVTDASGKVISTKDNGGTLTFEYDSRGNQTFVRLAGAVITSMTYDYRGKQATLTDKNAGTTEYRYNAYGELEWQKDANANQYTMIYDILGRLLTHTGAEGVTTNKYVASGNGINQIDEVIGFNGIKQKYIYDNWQRVTQSKETISVY
ncbi:MAG: hypothetical protein U5L45_15050, partial [Saprospiraceae bacterium]|nr:hypothetical protein [Saprospiraceae bacterium]